MKKSTSKLQLRSLTLKTLTTETLVKVQGGASHFCVSVDANCQGYTKLYTTVC